MWGYNVCTSEMYDINKTKIRRGVKKKKHRCRNSILDEVKKHGDFELQKHEEMLLKVMRILGEEATLALESTKLLQSSGMSGRAKEGAG